MCRQELVYLFLPFHHTCLVIKAGINLEFTPADFKQALGQQSSTGPAPPSKLTTHQTQIVKALIDGHGDDVEVPSPQGSLLVPVLLQTPFGFLKQPHIAICL